MKTATLPARQQTLLPDWLELTPVGRRPIRLPEATRRAAMELEVPAAPIACGDETAAPRTTIVVVTWNKLPFTKLLFASLLANTHGRAYEVIVVDNASTDATPRYLQSLADAHRHVRVIFNDTNRGFAAANNQALATARGERMVLLNNDTIVPGGWLARLDPYLDDPRVGLIGPVTNRIGNEAEVETAYRTYGEYITAADERGRCFAGRRFSMARPAMFCLALRRDTWLRVGALDEQFELGFFEDDDYAMRARAVGLETACAEDVLVHHFGEASFGDLFADGRHAAIFAANRRRFETKWRVTWKPPRRRGKPAQSSTMPTAVSDASFDIVGIASTSADKPPSPRPAMGGNAMSEAAELRALLKAQAEEFTAQIERLQEAVYDLEAKVAGESSSAYGAVVRKVREMVRGHLPRHATVIVIGKGDSELLKLYGRKAWHFPRDERGGYAGFYPANSTAAIAHLESLRAEGGQYLLIPDTARWWLATYRDFADHLRRRYRVACDEADGGIVFSLEAPGTIDATPSEQSLETVAAMLRGAAGREPAILDWTGASLAARYPRLALFTPPPPGKVSAERLAYIDKSIDVVAIQDSARLGEARRIASSAVVVLQGEERGCVERVHWTCPRPPPGPGVSIIIPVHNCWAHTQHCLAALRDTIAPHVDAEIIIVDDASTDETAQALGALTESDHRVAILRNEANVGFVGSCNLGARSATRELLVFLNNDTIPLPGWLEPLLQTFQQYPNAGAVGGKLLFPDGRLQEAGGIIFRDASAAHYGRYDFDCERPLFQCVRKVDYCSAALLATPRALFEEMGGFDAAFAPGYYEDTDYCFRLRERRRQVYFQPESVVIHLEGGTAGTDASKGMKRFQIVNQEKFAQRWRQALARRAERPLHFDDTTWHALATVPEEQQS